MRLGNRNSHVRMGGLFACLFSLMLVSCSESQAGESPAAAVKGLMEALENGDLEGALALTFLPDEVPAEVAKKKTERLSAYVKKGGQPKIVADGSKEIDDCAVVVIDDGKDGRVDYDPAYVLKDGETWKVLFGVSGWERDFEFSEAQQGRFEELEKWFRAEKARLRAGGA